VRHVVPDHQEIHLARRRVFKLQTQIVFLRRRFKTRQRRGSYVSAFGFVTIPTSYTNPGRLTHNADQINLNPIAHINNRRPPFPPQQVHPNASVVRAAP
jgi:hypothetical protein